MKNRLPYLIILLFLITALCAALSGCDDNERLEMNLAYADSDKYTAAHTGNATEITSNIEVEWGVGNITVRQSDEVNFITFRETCEKSLSEPNTLHWRAEGDALHLKYCAVGKIKFEKGFRKDLEIFVPSGVSLSSLEIKSINSLITCSASCVDLDVNSSEGGIFIKDCAANTSITTISARVDVVSSSPNQSLQISGVSGQIKTTVDEAIENIDISSSSGSVTLIAHAQIGDAHVSTSSATVSAYMHASSTKLTVTTKTSNIFLYVPLSNGFDLKTKAPLIGGTFGSLNKVDNGEYVHDGIGKSDFRLDSDTGTLYIDPIQE